jgi:hypothetical protein
VHRITPCNLLDCELRRCDDGSDALEIALVCGPTELELTRLLTYGQVGTRVLAQSQACRLKNGRDCRADDVLAVVGKVGVAAGQETGATTAVVPVEGNLEHDAMGA